MREAMSKLHEGEIGDLSRVKLEPLRGELGARAMHPIAACVGAACFAIFGLRLDEEETRQVVQESLGEIDRVTDLWFFERALVAHFLSSSADAMADAS